MTPTDSVRARLSRLLTEAEVEIDALDRIAAEIVAYRPELDAAAPSRPTLALIAVDLHDYYTAAETLFERVTRLIDGDVPAGPDSHRELIEQVAAEIPPIRPPLISAGQRAWLHRLRGFRHFFRHAYAVGLDPGLLSSHADELARTHPALRAELTGFLDFVRRSRDALSGD